MRTETLLSAALFTRENDPSFSGAVDTASWERVALPHTWNALDGQDGGSDYYRGKCWYKIALPAPTPGKKQYIQLEGANHVAQVWCNGEYLGEHRGGFGTFRFELTSHLKPTGNELTVSVDNGEGTHVYPQTADFTFFGGLYRDVTLVEVDKAHFDLMKDGTKGVFVMPRPDGDKAHLRLDAFPVNAAGAKVLFTVLDAQEDMVLSGETEAREHTTLTLTWDHPHLWQGVKDPYLYTAVFTLMRQGEKVDEVAVPFGVREYRVDPNEGFLLNGKSHPLRGVCRHQDRLNMGWAIGEAEHEEDIKLIREVGANTIRLAHYQQAGYFYDLCDRTGLVIWAEIPFISVFDPAPEARENTLSQMRELIAQNYNHPSICFWGISNEITIGGDSPKLQDNLRAVNELAHELDPTRLTTMAQVTMVPMDSPHNQITDVLAYNHYFGWYMGSVDQNGPWMDQFHALNPHRPLGISEYGAECVEGWHSATPRVRDYTEEYQAYYHEEMLKVFAQRPYLWGTFLWNMFDFAADARDEGGCKGRNNKGVVSYDRRTKKDAFYIYKACWSDEPFVHLCGRRFVDRAPGQRDVKVYSNQKEVTLTLNGETVGTVSGKHVFLFPDLPLKEGENTLTVTAPGELSDTITLRGVAEPNPDYVLPGSEEDEGMSEGVQNWFEDIAVDSTEIRIREGYYSIKDPLAALLQNPETAAVVQKTMEAALPKSMLIMAKGMLKPSKGGKKNGMADMAMGMPLEALLGFAGGRVPANFGATINEQLNKIKKG
ncbi:MAG: beta-galactosidase [Ruminiclostridium sp.]|nr:beta-galactosidase [Ruminiclostridium sp.]